MTVGRVALVGALVAVPTALWLLSAPEIVSAFVGGVVGAILLDLLRRRRETAEVVVRSLDGRQGDAHWLRPGDRVTFVVSGEWTSTRADR